MREGLLSRTSLELYLQSRSTSVRIECVSQLRPGDKASDEATDYLFRLICYQVTNRVWTPIGAISKVADGVLECNLS